MAFHDAYRQQVALLMRVLPVVAEESCFALKGGTAINLFVRDLPRLSVDIDLTYLPIADRQDSLDAIDAALRRTQSRLQRALPPARISGGQLNGESGWVKLLVRSAGVQVKVEVTPVLRGCVYPPEIRAVSPAVEELFGFAEIQVVSFADLYAGKLVAALDRQHPRDLFDVSELLANEGITADLRQAFLVYLVSHNRPMSEVLDPTRKDIRHEFDRGFTGMTLGPVAVEDLTAAREMLIRSVVGAMPDIHRQFLLDFKRGTPDWPSIGLREAATLPAVKWRAHNLDTLAPAEREHLTSALAMTLQRRRVAS